jgi:hypothetical protein
VFTPPAHEPAGFPGGAGPHADDMSWTDPAPGTGVMGHLLVTLLGVAALAGGEELPGTGASYLYRPSFCLDYELRGPAGPYLPQPGDIFLSTDRRVYAKVAHRVAGTAAPHHSGIVIARSDGRVAILEGGPHNVRYCAIVDNPVTHLRSYAVNERVWVRRRRVPLSPEQSAALTAFAERVDGKPFAVARLVMQATPLRARGPVRLRWRGRPRGEDRRGYFCAELVMEACVAAGLLDPETTRPSATYPRDMFFRDPEPPLRKENLDLSAWCPPARWTWCPGAEPAIRPRPHLDKDSR